MSDWSWSSGCPPAVITLKHASGGANGQLLDICTGSDIKYIFPDVGTGVYYIEVNAGSLSNWYMRVWE